MSCIQNLDQHLIHSIRHGDESAFASIYQRYSGKVYELAFNLLKEREMAEELVQDAFLKLWKNRTSLQEETNLAAFMYVLSKNLCFNKLKEIKRSKEKLKDLILHIDLNSIYSDEYLHASELERQVNLIIQKLSDRQKEIFQLSRFDGLNHQEIAKKLNISANTVKNHMVLALKEIKNQLNHVDFQVNTYSFFFFLYLFSF